MKYIKKFDTHTEYTAYKNGQYYLTPNVSYCVDRDEVHFGPLEDWMVATFNITDTRAPIKIVGYDERSGVYYTSSFSKIEVDGVVQSEVVGYYRFNTTGEHIVKYMLVDRTSIPEKSFFNCYNLTTISIPNGVTVIGTNAFYQCGLVSVTLPDTLIELGTSAFISCTGLTTVTIPDSVITIGSSFQGCNGLASINCLPTTPPVINSNAFPSNNCPIYVPAESVSAYQSARSWSNYVSRIQAGRTT